MKATCARKESRRQRHGLALCGLLLLAACSSPPPVDKRSDSLREADKWLAQGVAEYQAYHWRRAKQLYRQALDGYRRNDNPRGIVRSCLNLSRLAGKQARRDQQNRYLACAQDRLADITGPAQALHTNVQIEAANLARLDGEYDRAKKILAPLIDNKKAKQTSDEDATGLKLAALKTRLAVAIDSGEDATPWLQRYRTQAKNHPLHHARALRYAAQLQNDGQAEARLDEALSIYREYGKQDGVAATLQQWAMLDMEQGHMAPAEDKLRRALYIRQHLVQRKQCLRILQHLETLYQKTARETRLKTSRHWRRQLASGAAINWKDFIQAFDDLP